MKYLRKTIALAFLGICLLFVSSDILDGSVTAANLWPCDFMGQINSMNACGTSFQTTVDNYNNAGPQCYAAATAACPNASDPNWPTCMSNAYAACVTPRINAYDSRYGSYGDCITGQDQIMYNVDLCTYEPDYCPQALIEADVCIAQFPYENFENYDAREACLNAVPHGRPRGRDMGCPGFPIAP